MGVGRGALVGELYDWICGSVGSLLNFCPAPKGLLATLAWSWSSTSSTPGWMFFLAVWQGVIPVALRAFVVPLAAFFLAFAPLMEGDAVASGDETPFAPLDPCLLFCETDLLRKESRWLEKSIASINRLGFIWPHAMEPSATPRRYDSS